MTDRYVQLASDQAAAQERVAAMDKLDVKPMRVPKARRDSGVWPQVKSRHEVRGYVKAIQSSELLIVPCFPRTLCEVRNGVDTMCRMFGAPMMLHVVCHFEVPHLPSPRFSTSPLHLTSPFQVEKSAALESANMAGPNSRFPVLLIAF
jgi:hypothetical protein